ncbi:MAG: hypothetical protein A2017_11105 [Lentisphaerae bacterium GWF2_44_16]|nr:MAG: hypothetical protein A2017_11105 [Lentisphaerae bacterium GWF2_44_16]
MRTKITLELVVHDDKVEDIRTLVPLPLMETGSIEGYHNNVIKGEKATILAFSSTNSAFAEQLQEILLAAEKISDIFCDKHIVCYLIRTSASEPVGHFVLNPVLLNQMAKTGIEINLIIEDKFKNV